MCGPVSCFSTPGCKCPKSVQQPSECSKLCKVPTDEKKYVHLLLLCSILNKSTFNKNTVRDYTCVLISHFMAKI